MESNKRISELLVETGAFTDLAEPVILASGELEIYYVNAEKLSGDPELSAVLKKHKKDPVPDDMINHFIGVMLQNSKFEEVIDILAAQVDDAFSKASDHDALVVSGGQTRDWVFSGPVAHKLGVQHIAMYKDGRSVDLSYNGNTMDIGNGGRELYAVHVVDMLTAGSSCLDAPNGWIPQLRSSGVAINDLVTVVSRLQGGEANMEAVGVTAHPQVYIDENFLREQSTEKERALAYQADPRAWSEAYLRDNPIPGTIIGAFDPDGDLKKARNFLGKYQGVLSDSGKFAELQSAVQDKYDKTITEIVGDE